MLPGQTDRRCVSTALVPEPQRPSPDSAAITIPRTSLWSLHPSAPASRSRGRLLNSACGARRRAPAPSHSAAREAWEGGHSPGAPGSTPPAANLLQSWLQVAAVRSGARPGCSARPAAGDRCVGSRTGLARPHGARGCPSPAASSLARAPSAPRCVSLRPRPRLPAPALVSPTPRLRDSVRAARDPPRPWSEAPGDYQEQSPACTQASALEELVVPREGQFGDCSRISSWLLRLLLLPEFYWMLPATKGEIFAYPPPQKKDSKGGGEATYCKGTPPWDPAATMHLFRLFPTFRKSPNWHLKASLRVCSHQGEKLLRVWKGMQLGRNLLPPEIHIKAGGGGGREVSRDLLMQTWLDLRPSRTVA